MGGVFSDGMIEFYQKRQMAKERIELTNGKENDRFIYRRAKTRKGNDAKGIG